MDEEEIADSVSALLELSSLRQSLQKKLQVLECQSLLFSKDKQTFKESTDAELTNKVDAAKQALIIAQNDNANRERIGKMLLFGQEAIKSIHLKRFDADPDDITTDYNAMIDSQITTKLENLGEVNGDVSSQLKILSQLQAQYEDAKLRLQDIEWKSRDVAILVQNAESECDVTMQRAKAEEKHDKTRNLVESLNKSLKDLKLRKEVFQGLIHASKVDWIEDAALTDLMVTLGDDINLDEA